MNVKRIAAMLLAGAMTVGCLAGCGGNKTENNTDNGSASAATVDDRTKFVVGFDAAFPPYGYKDGDEYVGFDLDLAQAVCDYYGWELVKQPIDWDSKDMELGSGTIDCIWNGFTINGREDNYTWSEPYIDNSQVIVVKAESGINTLDDLAGKNVDVQADSSALAAIQGEDATDAGKKVNDSVAMLTQVADYNTAFQDLEAGAADAVAMDVGVANYQLANRSGDFTILEETISSEQYAIGFKLGNEELRDQVQEAMDKMVEDGTVDNILNTWTTMDNGAYSFLADTWCLGK